MVPAAVQADPRLQKLWALNRSAGPEDKAPLWDHRDEALQAELDAIIEHLGLTRETQEKDLSVVFVDISDLEKPRVADANGDVMMYAASLPKIAVLLAAFEQAAAGNLDIDARTEDLLRRMIRKSSNAATTELMNRVGKQNIAYTLLSPRYRLYDPAHNGGLWVGKDYAKAGLWRRDPLHNLSHGATAMQVARFYYLLETGNLVSPKHSQSMKHILSNTGIKHKFAAALGRVNPMAQLYRKSGTWRTYHSDSVLVQRDGRGYIAVALSNDPKGADWLSKIVQLLDDVIYPEG
ncbi:MAG: serine hydrolase [Deltaproteobacteria bacterium]|nr:serine hydrolase [Deltaproteobacteria bacterium]